MGRGIHKIISLILENPIRSDITENEYIRVAEHFGFCIKNRKGSHVKFYNKEHNYLLEVPINQKCIKEVYVSLLQEAILKIYGG